MSVIVTVNLTERAHVKFALTEPSTPTLGGENLSNLLLRLASKNTSDSKITQKAFHMMPKERCEKEISMSKNISKFST